MDDGDWIGILQTLMAIGTTVTIGLLSAVWSSLNKQIRELKSSLQNQQRLFENGVNVRLEHLEAEDRALRKELSDVMRLMISNQGRGDVVPMQRDKEIKR